MTGAAALDVSLALREVTAAVTVGVWIKPTAGGTGAAEQAVISFLGKGQLTTGVRYLPKGNGGKGAFGFVKQAGRLSRTSTRPMLKGQTAWARLYEHSPSLNPVSGLTTS